MLVPSLSLAQSSQRGAFCCKLSSPPSPFARRVSSKRRQRPPVSNYETCAAVLVALIKARASCAPLRRDGRETLDASVTRTRRALESLQQLARRARLSRVHLRARFESTCKPALSLRAYPQTSETRRPSPIRRKTNPIMQSRALTLHNSLGAVPRKKDSCRPFCKRRSVTRPYFTQVALGSQTSRAILLLARASQNERRAKICAFLFA